MTALHIDKIGQGPPLILLHGWGWNARIWQPLLPQLTEKYQVFLIDLPGFGKSPLLTADYTFEKIIPVILDKVPEKAAWLGWSLGGLFVWWVAIHHPQRISRFITVASSPRFILDKNWPGIPNITLEKFADLLLKNQKKTLQDFLELQLRGSLNQTALFNSLEKKLILADPISLPALIGGLTLLRETDFREALPHITCPSLHIIGQLDAIVPAKMIQALPPSPSARYEVIHRTGHMPFLSHPALFIDLLDQFLC